ncbi:MAG: sodium:solute symporter [Bacteroidales bacterium]|nr:sodium:solute symporter [Bacteroidales bacterium]
MSPTIILITIIIYFAFLFVISYFTGKNANNDTFFVGNKKSPWFVVSFGMIGASLSGVTFISVPGWVGTSYFSYLQLVLGYLLGYFFIAKILLPIYYNLNLTSIYSYLEKRFGYYSYKTGASFFLLSRSIGAAFRLFIVANVLQLVVFDYWHIPFIVTVGLTILLIWLYTFKGGIRTIVWTDTLQTLFMLLAVGFAIYYISSSLNFNFKEMVNAVADSKLSKTWFFDDWNDKRNFFKQFFSGAFITIAMTGLDQDMMQKNLSCKNLKDAQKNMYWYGFAFLPANILFMSLGVLLYIFASKNGIAIPAHTDDLFPIIATKGFINPVVGIFFILGLIAAAYSSADSALTALTTSFTIDILNIRKKFKDERTRKKIRMRVHIGVSIALAILIMLFKAINNQSVISAIFTVAGYTYGPLLGMYAFGLFTNYNLKDKLVPYIAIASPIICLVINHFSEFWFNGYKFGFELLILNGLITFIGLLFIKKKNTETKPRIHS